MIKISSAVLVVLAFCLITSGCGGRGSASTLPSQWVTVSGRNVSLRLPALFKGGDPENPAVMSVLRGMAKSRSNPEERESLGELLDNVEVGADQRAADTPSLMAWAAPNGGGSITTVAVSWSPLQNLLAVSNGDSSMRALVDAYMIPVEQQYWKLDSLTAREASVIVRYGEAGDGAPAEFIVIKVVGDSCYTMRYACPDESWNTWYRSFEQSSQTFELIQ